MPFNPSNSYANLTVTLSTQRFHRGRITEILKVKITITFRKDYNASISFYLLGT